MQCLVLLKNLQALDQGKNLCKNQQQLEESTAARKFRTCTLMHL